jgi:hypothetical protein
MVEGMRTTRAVLEMIREVAGPEPAAWFEEELRT